MEGESKRKRGRNPKSKPSIETFEPEEFEENLEALMSQAFIKKIQGELLTLREAVTSTDGPFWKKAAEEEMNSIKGNKVLRILERPLKRLRKKQNIMDSKLVLNKNKENNNSIRFQARLVTRGFKDKTYYSLNKTYAPVSSL